MSPTNDEALDEKRHNKAIKRDKQKAKDKEQKEFLEGDEDLVGLLSDKDLNKLYGNYD